MTNLTEKLKQLPTTPGVYFHKNKEGEIIYVGKASNLKNRVKSYFLKLNLRDIKTEALIAEIYDTDWIELPSEMEALFYEAEMIRRYMPKYNILLRDDKSLSYIRIDINSEYPTVTTTRRPLDDKAKYFGPYLSSQAINNALRSLRKVFPFAVKKRNGSRVSLEYHLGLDPGLEENKTSLSIYRQNLRSLIQVIKGNRKKIEKELEQKMQNFANEKNFEKAKQIRNQLFALKQIDKKVIFGGLEYDQFIKDHALGLLVKTFQLDKYPRRIEGYDISHQQGSDVVASMVVFVNGVSDKASYRKFKTRKDINDDFYNMNETIKRRLSKENLKKWGSPDFILIDGGKGQLDAAIRARDEMGSKVPMVSLAKKREQIIVDPSRSNLAINIENVEQHKGLVSRNGNYQYIEFPSSNSLIRLLQRIRDESHRFAVSYHSSLKRTRQTKSAILELAGVGPKTRTKLIKKYGSIAAIKKVQEHELANLVGQSKAKVIIQYLK